MLSSLDKANEEEEKDRGGDPFEAEGDGDRNDQELPRAVILFMVSEMTGEWIENTKEISE